MKRHIDADKCIGSGNCDNAAPAVFRLGDDGLARVLNAAEPGAAPAWERRVRGVALGCPTGAISLDDH